MSKQQPSKPAKKGTQRKKDESGPAKKDGTGTDKEDERDLTTVLDESQRADLTLLIADASESMRKLLVDNFDAGAGLNQGLLKQGTGATDEEKMMNAQVDPASADVAAYDRERKLLEQYEKDLSTEKMKTLKQDALKAYDEWREEVLQRVGKVVNSQETAQKQLQKSKSGSARPQAPQTAGKVTRGPPPYKFRDLFPPTKTPLTKLDMEKRTLVLHSILLLLLSLEHYNAPSRILLLNLTSSLKLPLRTFEQDEYATAKGLLEAAKEMTASEEAKKRAEENKGSRKWKMQMASVAGAAIIGVAGGLAAPMVAAGVGSIMGGLGLGTTAAAGYLGSVAGSTYLVGGLFGAYGGRMTGQMMDNLSKDVEDFAFLPVHSGNKTSENEQEGAKQASDHDHKLRVTICISGWLTEKEEVVKPWKVIGQGAEVFALKYELEALLNLGNAMNGMVQSAAWGVAQKQLIAQTVFADLAAAMWPMALIKASRLIDNPFSVAKGRADKAGEVMADALINKAQGERPVTLIGYSMGARVIYSCLKSLASRKAFGLIESVVMIGSPIPSDTSDWRTLRSVVSGRLVNVFSQNDYILAFMYRTSAIQYGVAGLQKVEGLAGVENVDVSEDVNGHTRYRFLVGSILKKIGFEDINMEAVEEEQVALEKMIKEEKKQSLQSQRNRLTRRESTGGKEDEEAEADHEAGELEKQVKDQTQKSLTAQAIEWFYSPNVPNAKDYEKIASNLQKAANDPSDAAGAVGDTARDIQSSTESYAQWAASKLPSMSYMGGSKTNPTKVGKTASDSTKTATDTAKKLPASASDPSKAAKDTAAATQSYTTYAASYLPSLPSIGGKGTPAADGKANKVVEEPTKTVENGVKKVSAAAPDSTKGAVDTAAGLKNTAIDSNTSTQKQTTNIAQKVATNTSKQLPASTQDSSKKAIDTAAAAQNTATDVSTTAQKTGTDVAQKTANDTAASAKSYTSYATGYLPSLPSLPSVPGRGRSTKGPTDGGKKAPDTAKETVDSASKQAKSSSGTAKKAPIIHQATDKAPDAGEATDKVSDLSKTASGQKKSDSRSYTSYASSYIPSLPSFGRSTPQKSDPKGNEGESTAKPDMNRKISETKKQAPKLDRQPSGSNSAVPKLDRKPSEAKTPAPKLDRKPSEVKAPAPKLDRKPSEVKASAPKLERKPSGAPKLERQQSGVKSQPPKLDRQESGVKTQAPKLDRLPSGVKKPLQGLQRTASGMKSPSATASKATESVPGAKQGTDAVNTAVGKAKETVPGAKQGSDAVASGAKTGGNAVNGATSKAKETIPGAKQGSDAVASGAKTTTDAVASGTKRGSEAVNGATGKAKETVPGAKQGTEAVSSGAKATSDAVGAGVKQGSDAVTGTASAIGSGMKQGGDAVTGAAGKGGSVVNAGVTQAGEALGGARKYTPKIPGVWN